jgi:hypothetical protein
VGPRAGLDGCGKSRSPPGFDPRTVQPLASHYTDCAIPARTRDLLNTGDDCTSLSRDVGWFSSEQRLVRVGGGFRCR